MLINFKKLATFESSRIQRNSRMLQMRRNWMETIKKEAFQKKALQRMYEKMWILSKMRRYRIQNRQTRKTL